MKTLNDYFAMNYRMEIVEDKDEGGFVVSFPELPGCITCGETVESAVANALDAKKAWLEAALEDGIEIHEPDSLEDYSGQFKLRIPRSLHRSLAEHSKREGISMNQYCVYLLSRNDAVRSIEKYSENQSDEKYMMVQSGGSHMKVFLKDIVYAEVYNRKVIIHTRDTNIEYYGKLQELSEIAGADFFRTHRAYLVHFKYVQKYDANCVTMENGTALIAKQNYPEFVKQYLKYNQRKGKEIG